MAPDDVLFLSDREAELDAAIAADMNAACLARAGEAPPGFTSKHPTFASFEELEIEL